MTPDENIPIVILGGFLSPMNIYSEMSRIIQECTHRNVLIVDVQPYDWFPVFFPVGWRLILDKLDRTVRKAVSMCPQRKAILVGHSQGGVLARLYLSDLHFYRKKYSGFQHITRLVTLGSPHHNQGGMDRGGPMARWIDERLPGTYYAPQVSYLSVAGQFIQGNPNGSSQEQKASRIYQQICGDPLAWGDAITPCPSALLKGSEKLVLDGVSHYSIFGESWYGSANVVQKWCQTLLDEDQALKLNQPTPGL
jgi:pimeloyl-ACP methyl ester carboxylesterase